MAEEYNVPWKREGDFIITGNGKIHKDDTDKILNQRDHEVNNLRQVNNLLKMSNVRVGKTDRKKNNFIRKYLK